MRRIILLGLIAIGLLGCSFSNEPPRVTAEKVIPIDETDICYPGAYYKIAPPPKLPAITSRVYKDPELLNAALLDYISELREYNSSRIKIMEQCRLRTVCYRTYK